MPKKNDLRELVLLSLYPDNIPTTEYPRVINLLSTLAVKMLSEGKLKPPGSRRAPKASKPAKSAPAPRRNGILREVRKLLQEKPHTSGELARALGMRTFNNYHVFRALKARRGADGRYYLRPQPVSLSPDPKDPKTPGRRQRIQEMLAQGPKTHAELFSAVGGAKDRVYHILKELGAKQGEDGRYAIPQAEGA